MQDTQEEEEEKGDFHKLLRMTVKSVLSQCFQGHSVLIDLTILKEVLSSLDSGLLLTTAKILGKLVLS